jgi:hypothetical protein
LETLFSVEFHPQGREEGGESLVERGCAAEEEVVAVDQVIRNGTGQTMSRKQHGQMVLEAQEREGEKGAHELAPGHGVAALLLTYNVRSQSHNGSIEESGGRRGGGGAKGEEDCLSDLKGKVVSRRGVIHGKRQTIPEGRRQSLFGGGPAEEPGERGEARVEEAVEGAKEKVIGWREGEGTELPLSEHRFHNRGGRREGRERTSAADHGQIMILAALPVG